MMKLLLYLILIIFFYKTLSKLISLPKMRGNKNKNQSSKGVKYKDAEFEEID